VGKFYGYLKPWEVSKYLGIRLEEVEKMLERQELPSTMIDGNVRVPWDKLESWLDEEVDEHSIRKLGKHLPDVEGKDVSSFLSDQNKDAKA